MAVELNNVSTLSMPDKAGERTMVGKILIDHKRMKSIVH